MAVDAHRPKDMLIASLLFQNGTEGMPLAASVLSFLEF
jgi:hypothetical protein